MRIKLTAANQRTRFLEDVERVRQERRPDFSIGEHLLLLMERMDALEAAAVVPREGRDT